MLKSSDPTSNLSANTQPKTATKKGYTKPEIYSYGDYRDITFGVSGGMGESGMESTHQAL